MNNKIKKAKRHLFARMRYAEKRLKLKWKIRKRDKKIQIQYKKIRKRRQEKKSYTQLIAPKFFSLIENTDEVLGYFKKAENFLRRGDNVTLDISDVDHLSSDSVTFMVANIRDIDFIHHGIVKGNAPKKPELFQLFTESGFYDHVKANGTFSSRKGELLHKEVRKKVDSEVAKEAALIGIRHVFGNDNPFEPLYNILIECMSNTRSHADLETQGKCNWWLYTHNFPNERITAYSFLDLGVGIFKSAVVNSYFIKMFKGTSFYKNINLVDDLLAGKVQSRIDIDNEIRGKGIPQIVDHSGSPHFRSFYIITNDIKIDLKTGAKKQLKNDLNGTFLYWELQN